MPVNGYLILFTGLAATFWWAIGAHRRKIRQVEDAQLALRVESLGLLAAGIAHDFNNTLMVIEGSASLIQTDPETAGSRTLEAVGRARSFNRRLMKLSQRRQLEPALVELDEHIAWLDVLIHRILPLDVRLEMDLGAPGCCTRIAPLDLTHILVSVVARGLSGAPERGRFRIETRPTEQRLTLRILDTDTSTVVEALSFRRESGGLPAR